MFDFDNVTGVTMAMGGVGIALILTAIVKGSIEIHNANKNLAVPANAEPLPAVTDPTIPAAPTTEAPEKKNA